MPHLLKFTLIAAIALSFTACYNAVEQSLYNGNYENALENALHRMRNDRKQDEYIAIAEKAYDRILDKELSNIERLKSAHAPSNWGKIFYLYQNLDRKQNVVEPYLPISYTNGKIADFPIHNFSNVIKEARAHAADYHYQRALQMLEEPYKEAARDAYSELHKIDPYYRNYKNKEQLKYTAKEKGTNHILLDFKEGYNVNLPSNFMQALSSYNYENKVEEWSRLYRDWTDTFEYDMVIQITVERVDISPEHVKEIHFHEQKQIEDGTQPLIDREGNYVVDSTGTIIQVPKYTTLHCHVTEWVQDKSARIYSSFKILDNRYQRKLVDQQFEDNVQFANNYANANGHIEILNNELKHKLKNRPLPFPTNYDMIMQTSENLKHQIATAIDRYDEVLASF